MDNDLKRFCLKCYWYDVDYGCISRLDEAVYQCKMYMHYHPEEVIKFNEEMDKWCNKEMDKK